MSNNKQTSTPKKTSEPSVVEELSRKAEKVKSSTKALADDDSNHPASGYSTPTSGYSDIPSVDGEILDLLEHRAQKLSKSLDKIIQKMTKKLHEASAITVGYSQTYNDAAATLGAETDEAIKSMYKLIAHCEELDETMKPVHKVYQKIKHIKTVLAALEAQVPG